MKFNKELDENAVPEWKSKYLDYKQGKKKLKAVAKALRTVPQKSDQRKSPFESSLRDGPVYSFLTRGKAGFGNADLQRGAGRLPGMRSQSEVPNSWLQRQDDVEAGAGVLPKARTVDERSPLRQGNRQTPDDQPGMAKYGSIIGSPAGSSTASMEDLSQHRTKASMLELPDPALDPERAKDYQRRVMDDPDYDRPVSPGSPDDSPRQPPQSPPTQHAQTGSAHEVRRPFDKPTAPPMPGRARSFLTPYRTNSMPVETRRLPILQRVFSVAGGMPSGTNSTRDNDVELEAYREVDFRKAEFFLFLDQQLDKIESFYQAKEDEAQERLKLLRHQLHIMRNHRVEELEAVERQKREQHISNGLKREEYGGAEDGLTRKSGSKLPGIGTRNRLKNSVVSQMDTARDKLEQVRTGHVGKTSKAMRALGTPSSLRLNPDNRDYGRKPDGSVSYRTAKKKLKAAITEYYRGLELLKNYALLNQTAFRKITKKCDKTLPGSEGKDYMNKHVNGAKFVTSQTLNSLTDVSEDLYARYFERGNRKMAIEVLREKGYRHLDYSLGAFRAGFFGGTGLALAISGLYYANRNLQLPNGHLRVETDYLLQIYAGYFLVVLLACMFCFECAVFKRNNINYKFIFELNSRSSLDWRQLSEIPALFLFLLGLVMNMNFQWAGGVTMYRYWPIVLVGITVLILLFPAPIYYWKTRRWLICSVGRLFGSGIYPVEFRDLFLGDVSCSLTYTFGNIALFFCLYAHSWHDPPNCNSSHSKALGILTLLPGFFRAAQCVGRFLRTGNAFPHLANMVKYGFTMGMYFTLMLWRLDKTYPRLIAFSVISTINSIYCIVWDIKMDFSLFDVEALFLKKETIFWQKWWYYAIMVIDPVIRFNWIFYVIFSRDVQHSSMLSFFVSLAEVVRRGLWALFRIENEQTANNGLLKASRDMPVPFTAEPYAPAAPSEDTEPSPLVQTLRRVGSTMATAHSQDYVRKTPGPNPSSSSRMESVPESESEDE